MTIETYKIIGGKAVIEKDPDAILDYGFDWSDFLTPLADTINTVTFIPDPSITLVSQFHDTKTATAFISGGTPGTTVPLTCRITTHNTPTARVDDRTIYLKIKEK